jgi:WD40 repeat protein/energy-coupling factor transporter ATP-binding protein EcfA2
VSQLFISHSNRDKAIIEDMAARLRERGHGSLFIDFDPEAGIAAGSKWLRELYRNLDACEGVIVACSEYSMASHWCFAEIAIAYQQGKTIIPVKVSPCLLPSILDEFQVIDLTAGEAEGYERLWRGLKYAGIEPYGIIDWIHDRPPYPGLTSFKEEDEPIFFGRSDDINRGLQALRQLRIPREGSFLLVLGASGSGKSSLVRAGILPPLRRSGDWLVIDPFLPGTRPLEHLAVVLARAFAAMGRTLEPAALERNLSEQPPQEALRTIVRDLRTASGRGEATVLFTIDQFEELLDQEHRATDAQFLSFWAKALGAAHLGVIVVATLRLDFLTEFQIHPALEEVRRRRFYIDPIKQQAFRDVIEGPAKRAGIEIEQGLIDDLLEDAPGAGGLPLLAFVLRELWERGKQERKLTRAAYRIELKGLEGVIGRVADDALGAGELGDTQWQALRHAFRQLVRINEEKQRVRQRAYWRDLPDESRPLLERLVDARLLTSGMSGTPDMKQPHEADAAAAATVEVAHEALFYAWGLLNRWLAEDEEFLFWRRRLHLALESWEESGRDQGSLLSGRNLEEAKRWLVDYPSDLTSEERGFITLSADRATRRRRVRVTVAAVTFSVIGVLVSVLFRAWEDAQEAEQLQLAEKAENHLQSAVHGRDSQDDPLTAGFYFLRAAEILQQQTERADNARFAAAQLIGDIALSEILDPGAEVQDLDIHPSAPVILTLHPGARIDLWDIRSARKIGEVLPTKAADELLGARFLKDGRVAFWSRDGTLAIGAGVPVAGYVKDHRVPDANGIDFDRSGNRAVTWDAGGAYVWSVADGRLLHTLSHQDLGVGANQEVGTRLARVWISDDGSRLISRIGSGRSFLWDVEGGRLIADFPPGGSFQPRFSPDSRHLLYASEGNISLIDAASGETLRKTGFPSEWGVLEGALFLSDGAELLLWTSSGSVEIWDASALERIGDALIQPGGESIHTPVISGDGQRILVRQSRQLRLWDSASRSWFTIPSQTPLQGAQLNRDGKLVLSWGDDNQARVWDSVTGQLVGMPMLQPGLRGARFLPRGGEVVTWGNEGTLRLWSIGGSTPLLSRVLRIDNLRAAAIGPDAKSSVTVSDGRITRWDTNWRPLEESHQVYPDKEIDGVILSRDTSKLLGWSSTALTLWDSRTGEVQGSTAVLPDENTSGLRVQFSPDGNRILLWGRRFPARVWITAEVQGGMRHLEGLSDRLIDAAFSAEGQSVAGYDQRFRLHVWDSSTGRKWAAENDVLHLSVAGVRLHEKAGLLVSWGTRGALRLWDPVTGKPSGYPIISDHPFAGVEFDPEGSRLLTWSDQGNAQIWDLHRRSPVFSAVSHGGAEQFGGAHWSDDGKRFLTFDRYSLRLWDADSGLPLTPLLLNNGNNKVVRLGPRGNRILAWNTRQARLWDLVPQSLEAGQPSFLELELRCGCQLSETGGLDALGVQVWRALSQTPPAD